MSKQLDFARPALPCLECMSVEELLLVVGDEDLGCKPQALERLLALGLAANMSIYEQAIRDDERADLRNGAMEVMIRFGREAVPKLLEFLQDDNEEIRNFSTIMLGEIGSREAIVPLIQTLRDADVNVRHGAAEALGKIGDRAALVPLLELLKEDFWQQYPAIAAIAATKDNRAVPHLLKLLDNDLLTEAVIDALGEIGDPRSLLPLGNLIGNSDMALAGKIVRAIVKIYRNIEDDCRYRNSMPYFHDVAAIENIIDRNGCERIKLLLNCREDPDVVKSAITVLGWLGESAALDDIFLLLDKDDFLEQVENAILAMGKGVVHLLIEALNHPSEYVRIVAVRSLRWIGGEPEREKIVLLLSDTNENVLGEVLESLKGTAIHAVVPRLIEILKEGREDISTKSAEVLGYYPYSEVQKYHEELISSPDAEMRRRAVLLLGSLHQHVPLYGLGVLARDPSPSVRKEALKVVGQRKLAEVLPALLEALDDADSGVKEEAVMALAEFGSDDHLQKILWLLGSGSESLNYAVIRAVSRIASQPAGNALYDLLMSGTCSNCIEFALIDALGKIGYKPAIPVIEERYLKHTDADIRRCAVLALGEIADSDSRQVILDTCGDSHWSVRIAALEALVRISGKSAVPVLLEAVNDRDQMVRKNAIQLLGDLREINAISRLAGLMIDPDVARYAFEALLKYGRTALPWLHRIMQGDYQVEVRERVIDLVGKIGDRKSVEALTSMLDDSHAAIRLAAIDSLVFCFDSVPLKRLAHMIHADRDEEVKGKADLALKILTMENFFP